MPRTAIRTINVTNANLDSGKKYKGIKQCNAVVNDFFRLEKKNF